MKKSWNLNNMVSEINFFPFFSGSILHIENANEVGSPAPQNSIEELEENSRRHSQLREWVGQRQQHLSYLHQKPAAVIFNACCLLPQNTCNVSVYMYM